MLPEKDWFRPPRHLELIPEGDARRFLWVAEPVLREGIFGVSYAIAHTLLMEAKTADIMTIVKDAALKELHRRIAAGECTRVEGSHWNTFAWEPIFVRDDKGNITVQETI